MALKTKTFGNLQVGIVDDPSVEDKGGFEFASGMDIFSEPGVMKANFAMTGVTFGASATPTDVPRYMVDTVKSGNIKAYIAAGAKILESTDGSTFNLFRTNTNGNNLGLGIWNGYVIYLSDTKLGRTLVGDATLADDSYITTLDSALEYPCVIQAGTLKIGASKYVASLDESFTLTPQAMKLPDGYKIRCLAEHFNNLLMGTYGGSVLAAQSAAFAWGGIPLAAGSALPDTPFPGSLRGMNALLSDGRILYGFPDRYGDIYVYDGSGFKLLRQIVAIRRAGSMTINPGSVCQNDKSILFGGDTTAYPGVYELRDGALCQSYVPSVFTQGNVNTGNIGFVKSSFSGVIYIGYYENSNYHIERTSSNRQNNAVCRTLWHRMGSDRLKRWAGIKLNCKPIPGSCSIAVAYRTQRDTSFSSTVATITSSNQDRPVLFSVAPRSREIEYQLTFTTSSGSTPEFLSYDPLFEELNTMR